MCACVHVIWRCHFYSNLGFEVGGILLPLLVPCVCIASAIALHQSLHCYCLHSLGLSCLGRGLAAAWRRKVSLLAQQLLNPRPDIVFLVVAHILNHNSGRCSGNIGFLQLALGFEGGL